MPRVLSKIVESVADEMCRLMQCVSSFSKNGALQVNGLAQGSHSEQALTHKETLRLGRGFHPSLPLTADS